MKTVFISGILIFSTLSFAQAYDKVRNSDGEYPFTLLTTPASKLQTDKFAEQAKSLNSVLGLNFGKNQSVQMDGSSDGGSPCQVYINNKTAIDPTFPESSKRTQRIDILVQAHSQSSKFFLSRTSQVREFDLRKRTESTTLYIRANNKTSSGGTGRMIQEARITRTHSADNTLALEITDFNGKPLACTIGKK